MQRLILPIASSTIRLGRKASALRHICRAAAMSKTEIPSTWQLSSEIVDKVRPVRGERDAAAGWWWCCSMLGIHVTSVDVVLCSTTTRHAAM